MDYKSPAPVSFLFLLVFLVKCDKISPVSDNIFTILEYSIKNAIACVKNMDYNHVLLLWAVGIVFVVFFIRNLHSAIKKRREIIWSTVSALFVCLLMFSCIVADAEGTLVFLPGDTPENKVTHFFDSVVAGDMEAAARDLATPRQLIQLPEEMSDTDSLYYEALKSSFSYSLYGTAIMEKTHATQTVEFTYLDLNALPDPIRENVMEELERVVDERRKDDVYDENENYKPEILDEVYHDSVAKILESAQDYYVSTCLDLSLDYMNGKWVIDPADDMLTAFAGGSTAGANFANNAKSEVLGELTYIPKHYTIAEDALLPPAPNPDKYGKTDDPEVIQAILDQYPRLTGIDEPFWNKDIQLREGSFNYYADETIVVIAWRETYNMKNCTFADIYIADPSQLRRKLTEDTYGSAVHKPASALAKEANAVIALNGDFYKFRTVGVTSYQRTLYRFNPGQLELCHVDASGNLNFTYANELKTKEEAEQYIKDNDILFTLAFGPVLVENYEIHPSSPSYLLGQVGEIYSRSALGQRGSGHYLLMTMNYGGNIEDSKKAMKDMGVERAYAVDGGQTAEIVLNNQMFNPVDYRNERFVSDIICFDTALPEDENK